MRATIIGSVILWGIILSLTGCGVATHTGSGLTMTGSPEAYRALLDGVNGIITNTKTKDPNGDSAHWHHRGIEEAEITKRAQAPGFFQGLFGIKEEQGS